MVLIFLLDSPSGGFIVVVVLGFVVVGGGGGVVFKRMSCSAVACLRRSLSQIGIYWPVRIDRQWAVIQPD